MVRRPKIDRVEFNRAAKQARVDDNPAGLRMLALSFLRTSVRAGSAAEDLRQTLAIAAVRAANDWWDNGGNAYKKIDKAIKSAARDWRGRGGATAALTWRGGYSTDKRKFSSQIINNGPLQFLAQDRNLPEEDKQRLNEEWQKSAKEIQKNFDSINAGEDIPAIEADTKWDDERDQRDAERERLAEHENERLLEQRAERRGGEGLDTFATNAAEILEGGAERTSHDGGHADGERLNPRDDGEVGYGVDGATHGLHTGRIIPPDWWIANERARTVESAADQTFLSAIEAAGGFNGWVNKDGNRKRARAAHEARLCRILARVRDRACGMLEADRGGLLAGWLAERAQDGPGSRAVMGENGEFRAEPVAALPGPPGVQPWAGTVSAAWPKEAPARRRVGARSYGPCRVGGGLYEVAGHEWAHQQRNLKAWRRHVTKLKPGEPLLSLLDMLEGVRTARAIRALHGMGWGEPLVRVPARSLLDV